MRVVAGELRGRRIEAPAGDRTRPTTDKVREAVFNALGSLEVLDGATVLDLFAGSGAMGIEALSRGAARCTFVENDRAALAALRRNLDSLGLAGRSTVVAGDARTAARAHGRVDVLIADPPYGDTDWSGILAGADVSVAVLESGSPIGPPPGWETVRDKRYGRTYVAFLRAVSQADERPETHTDNQSTGSPAGTVENE